MFVQTRAYEYHRFNDPTKRVVTTVEEFWNVIRYLQRFPFLAYDCETSGTAWFRHSRICGFSFSVWNPDGSGSLSWYVPFRHQTGEQQIPPDVALAGLKLLLEDVRIGKICHNLKFEMHMAMCDGIQILGPLRDTMIEAQLYDENSLVGLKDRAMTDLNDPAPQAHEHILTGILKQRAKEARMNITTYKDAVGYAQVPIVACGQYACYDTHATLSLASFYDSKNVRGFFQEIYDTEIDLTGALFRMERNGVPIDVQHLENLRSQTEAAMHTIAPQVFASLSGFTFNIGSDSELCDVLVRKLGLPLFKRTDSGQLSVDKEVLEHFSDDHPACALLLEWRSAQKINSTYTDSILSRLDANNILHGDFKQLGTNTGRLSAAKPNMQNFAGDSDKRALAYSGKKLEDGGVDPWSVKRAFVNRGPAYMRGYFDYSQIELRVLAEYSGDPTMIEVYRNNEDIHKRTQMEVFNSEEKSLRRLAKVINFGLSYCLSPAGFSRQAKIPLGEAERHMENFFKKYPRIAPFRKEFWAFVRKNGCQFQNMFGRPRRVPDLESNEGWKRGSAERRTIGSLIQGTAAQLTKIAIVRIDKWEQANRSGTLLCSTIHDEISADIPTHCAVEVGRVIKREMEDFGRWFHKVPILTDAEQSTTNWAEKSKWKELA